ncbi:MAG: type II secretion system inner membrane protein GspF [Desulfatiglans sp.]|jgi:general secretion pathway protein F|nr:type II secretion system inner membrane protein GspF [Thermodesulfobacteriota bacterium]MEE4352884.1 type II secretion system inner membrane protein GspF [Desulfatiglans sp.]
MPVYEYTALDRAGKKLTGIIDADSAKVARQKLRGTGAFPVEIQETSSIPKDVPSAQLPMSHLFKRVRSSELSATTRQLSILLGAGVTLVASLDTLITQISNPVLKKIMAEVKDSVNEGNSLAHSLSLHPKVFSEIYINMVRAGEASGSLDVVLARLAEFSENQQALKGRFQAAMAYPLFMFFVGSIVIFVLVSFIIPNIMRIFSEMEQTLPLPTLLLISLSNFFKSFWWLILIVLGGLVLLIKRLIRTPRGNRIWDEMKLRIPVIGQINVKMAMARFAGTLGSLLRSGVPILSALGIVQNIVGNVLIAEVINDAIDEIESGKSIAYPLSQSRWFPPIAVQMISVGEQSGELEAMLDKIAEVYERESESRILALTSMLEPVMILVIALAVAFIAVSILLPIFDMSQMIR